MAKVYSMDVKEQFIEMKAKEYSFSSISEELKVSKPTLIDWSKEFKMDIENRRSLEIEALQEKYFVTWGKRMALYHEQLERVRTELDNRDLSDMSSKELLEVEIKLIEKMKAEERKITLKKKGRDLSSEIGDMLDLEEWTI
jgi:transposase